MKHTVSLRIAEFAGEALAGAGVGSGQAPSSGYAQAVTCYLDDRGARPPGWAYPGFLRDSEPSPATEIEFEIEDDLWRAFEAEAERQGLGIRQMLEHAVLYFAAEVEAGRATERILADLEKAG